MLIKLTYVRPFSIFCNLKYIESISPATLLWQKFRAVAKKLTRFVISNLVAATVLSHALQDRIISQSDETNVCYKMKFGVREQWQEPLNKNNLKQHINSSF